MTSTDDLGATSRPVAVPTLYPVAPERWSRTVRAWLAARGIDETVLFDVPMVTQFRGVTRRRGILLHGPGGWGECAPFEEYGAAESSLWMRSAAEAASSGLNIPSVRNQVPVNVTIPVISAEEAAARAAQSGCRTAKVKVADSRSNLGEDVARVRAVAESLAERHGDDARVRVDANGAWSRDDAIDAIAALGQAAKPVGGLEYAEQPCMSVEDLAWVRSRTDVRIAADESIRRADDPFRVVELGAADVAVIKVSPLGGVRRALSLAEQLPIPVVVSSALDTSIGLSAGVALAAALPELDFACGLDTGTLLGADVVGEPLRSSGGYLDLDRARNVLNASSLVSISGGDHTSAGARELLTSGWIDRVEAMVDLEPSIL
ncbi:MAG: o-succinylbenzoate synthase [Ancrocorticia sp.]|uniref:o-succinylbenzoate synthase n=1 Tax=Ancrocorticia sp. TaxID=2593684 RepID=UPI003F8F162B